jgi:hypothetical protein
MRKRWLLCVVLGILAWGQAAPGTPPPAQPATGPAAQAAPGMHPAMPMAPAKPPVDTSASVPADAAVITVKGVCAAQPKPAAKGATVKPAAKTSATDCKTVVTKAEFEKLASSLSANVTPQMKKQLSSILPRLIAMSAEAKKKGLDKTPQFEETVKFAKMQILTNELQRRIQEEASKITPQEIEKYYKDNSEAYEQYNLDRLFVPRTKQEEPEVKDAEKDKEKELTDDEKKAKETEEKNKAEEAEQAMTKLAESLRARAAAGEDFTKLQKEAFEAGGMKIESPSVNLPKVRRTGLPPAHATVFDLKPGEVSQVINDNGGHYIYKVNSKDVLPLSQVEGEIHNTLQNQHNRDAMEKVNNSFKVETNEAYFGPPGPEMPPSPRGVPRPRVVPGPTSPPPAQPQAQPQTPKPN